jgi:hypothetical protein
MPRLPTTQEISVNIAHLCVDTQIPVVIATIPLFLMGWFSWLTFFLQLHPLDSACSEINHQSLELPSSWICTHTTVEGKEGKGQETTKEEASHQA